MDKTPNYRLKVKKEDDFLHVHVTGAKIREVLFNIASDIVTALNEHQFIKVLVDVTQLVGYLNTIDTYDLGTKDLPRLRQRARMKIAIVDKKISENLQFFETVCRNMGLNIRAFTSSDEAIQWLHMNPF